ncbi:MAG: aminotransferase class I/II-fold pyridoxal phosphate-dependent enzyme, partial [Steroidobacteraceae bacterium]
GAPARREFLYVDVLDNACVHLMSRHSSGEPVNVGWGKDISIAEAAAIVAAIIGFEPDGTPRELLDVAPHPAGLDCGGHAGRRHPRDLRLALRESRPPARLECPLGPAARIRSMQVPLLDLKPQYQALKADIDAAIAKVCDSQYFILGPAVRELEAAVAKYSHCAHGIGMSSGTDALLVALMALDIGPGDEVIAPAYTFFATAGTIARLHARPVFCDIEPASFNISPCAVQKFIDEQCELRDGVLTNTRTQGRVKALMPVHLYGQLADMPALGAIAKKYNLRIIEDAAQAIGAADATGRRAGSFGDIGCLSFFPTKNLGAFGDAGMCVTNDTALAERLDILRVHGGKPKYYHAFIGGNFRLDEIQAAVLAVKLPHLDVWSDARQHNAAIYDSAFATAGLGAKLITPPARPGHRHIYNQYVIRVEQRDALRAHLKTAGVGTEIYYPLSLHQQECFAYLGYRAGSLPESELAAATTIALPIYPELTEAQLRYVVDSISSFYRA